MSSDSFAKSDDSAPNRYYAIGGILELREQRLCFPSFALLDFLVLGTWKILNILFCFNATV